MPPVTEPLVLHVPVRTPYPDLVAFCIFPYPPPTHLTLSPHGCTGIRIVNCASKLELTPSHRVTMASCPCRPAGLQPNIVPKMATAANTAYLLSTVSCLLPALAASPPIVPLDSACENGNGHLSTLRGMDVAADTADVVDRGMVWPCVAAQAYCVGTQ